MKTTLLVLSNLVFCFTAFSNQQTAIINIDGVEHQVILGADQKIVIGEEEHLINIKLSKQSLFETNDISFSYISNMAFTEDISDPDFSMWNMDGDTNVIMVQKYQTELTSELLADSMREEFESMRATVNAKEAVLRYQDSQLTGIRLSISLGEIFLSQEIFSKTINGETICLILQDTLNDDKSHSAEYHKSLQLIQDTLSFK